MRIKPIHKVSTPVRPIDISKPVRAEENVEFTVALKVSKSPNIINRDNDTIKAITKKAIQI